MTTTEIATTTGADLETARAAARTAIELTADQREFTAQQIAVLKQLGIDDAPAAQLDLFFHRCVQTGLDPFAKQIYLIGRKTKVGGYRGEAERWETKYTIQTGIDGYRLNGRRAAHKAGESVKTEGPFWQGADGAGWSDVWLGGRRTPPAAAKFVIIADGQPHVGIAMYEEFVQTKANGEPNSMWAKMPANQLAKCAEAQAWRKAYPDDFSGLNLEDAVQVIEPDGSASFQPAERAHRSAAAVFDMHVEDVDAATKRLEAASNPGAKPDTAQANGGSTPVVSADGPENPESNSGKAKRRPKQQDIADVIALMDALQTAGVTEFSDDSGRLQFVRNLFDSADIAGPENLNPEQRSYLLTELRGMVASYEGRDTVAEATDSTDQVAGETEAAGR